MLTKEQNKDFQATMENPTKSVGSAMFYAAITGQGQSGMTINEKVDRIVELVLSLIASGVINEQIIEKAGCLGEDVQSFLDSSNSTDPRIVELKELTKIRFLVNKVAPARTLN